MVPPRRMARRTAARDLVASVVFMRRRYRRSTRATLERNIVPMDLTLTAVFGKVPEATSDSSRNCREPTLKAPRLRKRAPIFKKRLSSCSRRIEPDRRNHYRRRGDSRAIQGRCA